MLAFIIALQSSINVGYIHNKGSLLQAADSGHSPLLETSALSWLATIRSTSLGLLVATHTGTQRKIDTRGRRKAETLGHLHHVQLMHVKNAAQAVARIGLQIAALA